MYLYRALNPTSSTREESAVRYPWLKTVININNKTKFNGNIISLASVFLNGKFLDPESILCQ